MRRRGFGGGFGMRRRPMMMAPMMMMPRRRVVVVAAPPPPPKKKKKKVVIIHHTGPPPPGHTTTTTTVTHNPGGVQVGGDPSSDHVDTGMGVPVGAPIPVGHSPVGGPPPPVQIPGDPHGVPSTVPPIGADAQVEGLSQCKTCGTQFSSNEAHLHRCLMRSNHGMAQDTGDLNEPYDPEIAKAANANGTAFIDGNGRPRRNSIEHPGANHTGDLTQSLLPDKIIKKTLMSDPTYMHAWMDLNVGFLDRFKKIQESFRSRKLGFFEHVRGKKWKNIKNICPPIKYPAFLSNHNLVYTNSIDQWNEINHQYLIREVESLPKKCCAFCKKAFEPKKEVALLPCLDIVHYKCLKKKFRGFLFLRQKDSSCVCEMNLQEMYDGIKAFLNYT